MFVRALCGVILIALSAWPCAAQDEPPRPSPRPSPRMSRPLAQGPDGNIRMRSIAICGPGERQCAIGGAITWCCRADQQCSYSYPGACK